MRTTSFCFCVGVVHSNRSQWWPRLNKHSSKLRLSLRSLTDWESEPSEAEAAEHPATRRFSAFQFVSAPVVPVVLVVLAALVALAALAARLRLREVPEAPAYLAVEMALGLQRRRLAPAA